VLSIASAVRVHVTNNLSKLTDLVTLILGSCEREQRVLATIDVNWLCMPKLKILILLRCRLGLRASILGLVKHESLSSLVIKHCKPGGETTTSHFACLLYALATQRPDIRLMIDGMDIWSRTRSLLAAVVSSAPNSCAA